MYGHVLLDCRQDVTSIADMAKGKHTMAKMSIPILVDWESIKDYLDKSDIVEVIRCKDCIKKPLCIIYRETNDEYGYCAWAGRKEK